MLTFETDKRWYRHSGLIIFLLQISLFVAALPGLHHGTWFQVEPTMLLLFVLAALSALWLALGFATGWLALRHPVHPLLACMAAWVGWQWLVLPLAPMPWLSWFGHPANGEGVGYYTALLLSYLLAALLWQNHTYQKIMLALATFNLSCMAWYHFNPAAMMGWKTHGDVWNDMAPGNWPDYLAFLAIYLWIAFMAAPRVRTPSCFVWMTLIAALVIVGVSSNNTAKLLFLPGVIGSGIVLWLRMAYRPKWLAPNRAWRQLAMACCLLPFVWFAVCQSSVWVQVANGSLPTRALFNQVALSTLEHEPERLLFGGGWGKFPDDLFKYALVDGVSVFHEGSRVPSWGMIDGHAFHPHDEMTEVVLALGLPGLLLWLALPLAIIRCMPSRLFWWGTPMLLAMVGLQTFWFSLPQVMAYQALAWAALTPAMRGNTKLPGRKLALAGAIVAAIVAWSACAQLQAMRYGDILSHAVTDEPAENYSAEWLDEDIIRGGDRFIAATDFFERWVGQRTVTHEANARDAAWYLLLMQAAHRAAASPDSSAWLASTDMRLLNLLFMNTSVSILDTLKPQARDMLPGAVLAITKKAPLREDITAPFLYSLGGFTGGDALRAVGMLQHMLDIAPEHRAALWVMGAYLSGNPATQEQGKQMMRRAVELGVERVFPVTRAQVAAMIK